MSGNQSPDFGLNGNSFCMETQFNICVGGVLCVVCNLQWTTMCCEQNITHSVKGVMFDLHCAVLNIQRVSYRM